MDLTHLRTFVTVAEERHLTRAAERLFTSQPAVSAQLKMLEEELEIELFLRTPKGMCLTPAGETLLKQAQEILHAAHQFKLDAKALQGQIVGSLSLGINSDFSFLRLGEVLSYCQQHFPGIVLSFIQGMSADIVLDVRKNKLDAGFFFGPCQTSDVSVFPVADIPLAVMGPVAWKADILDSPIDKLACLPWIYTTERCPFYQIHESLFEGVDCQIAKSVFVDTEDAIRELVRSGQGMALMREDDVRKAEQEGWGVRWAGRDDLSLRLNVGVQSRRLHEPVIQSLFEALRSAWPTEPVERFQAG